MEYLNDDIVICILSYLDIESQQVLMKLHPRFYHLMPFAWAAQYKIARFSLFEIDFPIDVLKYFYRSIRNSVQVMHLKIVSIEQFDACTANIYPKVNDFRFALMAGKTLTDENMPKFIKSFPNLRTFSPQGIFSGKYFAEFPFLERLTVTYCRQFRIEQLINIMRTRQLKEIKLALYYRKEVESHRDSMLVEYMTNLESIKANVDEFDWFARHLNKLNNLKELIVCDVYPNVSFFDVVCNKFKDSPRRFKLIETNNSGNILMSVSKANIHVDALKLVSQHDIFDVAILDTETLKNIKEIYLKTCSVPYKFSFDNLLYNITNVDLISFEQCKFNFNHYEFNTSKITELRSKQLSINLLGNTYGNKDDPWIWKINGEENNLIKFQDGRDYLYSYEYIKMSIE